MHGVKLINHVNNWLLKNQNDEMMDYSRSIQRFAAFNWIVRNKFVHSLSAALRVYCSTHYYGQQCTVYCRPGYQFDCDSSGRKVCRPGIDCDFYELRRRLAEAEGILFSGCPSVYVSVCPWSHDKILWMRYFTNRLWEFHRVCNVRAVGDEDELIRLRGQKVKRLKARP